LGINNVAHNNLREHFSHFSTAQLNHKSNLIWKGMGVVVVWNLWKLINKVEFQNGIRDGQQVFCEAQAWLWAWIGNKVPKSKFSYSN